MTAGKFLRWGLTLGLIASACLEARAARWPDWAQAATDDACIDCYEDEDAVVLLDEWRLKLKGGERSGTRRRVVRVNHDDGRDAAVLAMPSDLFRSYSKVKMWIHRPGGGTRVFDQDDGTLLGVAEINTMDETQVMVLQPPPLMPGSTVAVECKIRRTADRPQDIFRIEEEVPVARYRVSVDARGGWEVLAAVANGDNPGPATATGEAAWEFHDLPGSGTDWQVFSAPVPRLTMALNYIAPGETSPFESWATTAEWASELFRRRSDTGSEVRAIASTLEGDENQIVETAGLAARRLRYFQVALGWGGFIPRTPATTLARAFGDCKDKTQLMIALLHEKGIEAYPVTVMAPSDGLVPDELPSPFLFNHVVTGIPWNEREIRPGVATVEVPELGALRLYDATLSEASAQDISPRLEGGAALVLHPGTTTLLRIPGSEFEDNVYEERTRVRIDPDGTTRVTTTVRAEGSMRQMFEGDGGERLSAAEVRETMFKQLSAKNPVLEELEVGEPEVGGDGSWSFRVSYVSRDSLGNFGALKTFDLHMLAPTRILPVPDEDDDEPGRLPFRGVFRESFDIEVDGWSISGLAESFDIENTIGRVSLTTESSSNRVELERRLELRAEEIPVNRREDVLALRTGLGKVNHAALILEPSDAPPEQAVPPSR